MFKRRRDLEPARTLYETVGEELTDNPQLVTDVLSSPEQMGNLGLNNTILNNPQNEGAIDIIKKFGELLRESAETAEDYGELLDSIVEDPLTTPPIENRFLLPPFSDKSNIGDYLFRSLIYLLQGVDEKSDTTNELAFMSLVNSFEIQGCLNKHARLCLQVLQNDIEIYSNDFRKISPLFEILVICKYDPKEDNWRQLLRRAGPVLETALTPVVALIDYLNEDKFQPERVQEEYAFADKVQKVSEFEPLEEVINYPEDYTLRNAVSHGGSARLDYNKLKERWKVQTDNREYELSNSEFQERALRFAAASISLMTFPLYLVSANTTVEVLRAQQNKA